MQQCSMINVPTKQYKLPNELTSTEKKSHSKQLLGHAKRLLKLLHSFGVDHGYEVLHK